MLASAGNLHFWSVFVPAVGGLSFAHIPLLAGSFAIVALLFHALLTLASFRFTVKPVLIASLLTASAAAWFINEYGIVIDRTIIQSIVETDLHEAAELLNWRLVLFVALTGGLPSLLVARMALRFPAGMRGLARRAGTVAASLGLAALLLVTLSKSLAPAVREHRELRYLLTPTNVIQATASHVRSSWRTPVRVAALGRDAARAAAGPAGRAAR